MSKAGLWKSRMAAKQMRQAMEASAGIDPKVAPDDAPGWSEWRQQPGELGPVWIRERS